MQVAIFTDDPGWHGTRLVEAFDLRGARARYLSLSDCGLELSTGSARLRLPGFGTRLPDAAFVRGVAGGALEEVVFRLDVLHALEAAGVPVSNGARAIERSVDKSLTSFLLARAGLPTPPTLVTGEPEEAREWVRREAAAGHRTVCKPLFGSQGNGLCLLEATEQLPDSEAVNGVWYLQRFIETAPNGASDWRLFVVGGKVVAAMRRSNHSWLTNVAQGGSCHAGVAQRDTNRLAEEATAILAMNYAGVDLMLDRDGRWWLIEINSIPAWRGLQSVCGTDIAGLLADDLLGRIGKLASKEVV